MMNWPGVIDTYPLLGPTDRSVVLISCPVLHQLLKIKLSKGVFKANMNSDKPLQTAAIFFSDELLSETGYWLGACHG